MRIFKMFLAVALSVMLVVTMLPFGVFATETEQEEVTVTDITFDDITRYYGDCDGINLDEEGNALYVFDYMPRNFTIHFSDETTFTPEYYNQVEEVYGEGLNLSYEQNTFDTLPEVGEVIDATVEFKGFEKAYTITIVESPVESIIVEDLEIVENTHGLLNEDTGEYVYELLWQDSPQYTVTLKDGTILNSNSDGEVEINGEKFDLDTNILELQYAEDFAAGNVYEITANFLGAADSFNLTINETAVQSIVINDIETYENYEGIFSDGVFYYSPDVEFTVTMNDGRTFESENGSVEIDAQTVTLECDWLSYQQSEPWTVGNTYTVTGSVLGVFDEFTVTVVESFVESISVEDISVVENIDGEFNNELGYFEYSVFSPITILLKDGRNFTTDYFGHEIDGVTYYATHDGELQQENQEWIAGNTYTVTIGFIGVYTTFNVTVLENPIDRVVIEPLEIEELTNGSYVEGLGFVYNRIYPQFTVFMKDGRTFQNTDGERSIEIDGKEYNLDIEWDVQNDQLWTVGNTYEVAASLGGVTTVFEITITESSIESIVIEDIEIIENDLDYMFYSEAIGYNVYTYENNLSITVNFKDGTVAEGVGEVEINGEIIRIENCHDSQFEEAWSAGNIYDVTASILGRNIEFKVSIVTTPVENVEISDIEIIANTNGRFDEEADAYYYNRLLPMFTVTLADGQTFEGSNGEVSIDGVVHYFHSDDTVLQENEPWTVGNTYTVTVSVMGFETTYNVSIVEDPVQSIVIDDVFVIENTHGYLSEELGYYVYNDFDYKLTVTFSDESTQEYIFNTKTSVIEIGAQTYRVVMQTSNEDEWTVDGIYDVAVSVYNINSEIENAVICNFNISVVAMPELTFDIDDVEIVENTCGEYSEEQGYFLYYGFQFTYRVTLSDGTVLTSDDDRAVEIYGQKYYTEGDITSQLDSPWTVGNTYPIEVTFLSEVDTLNISIIEDPTPDPEPELIIGDIDGDGEITDWDEVILARYLAGWDVEIPDLTTCDIDGDGEVTDWDEVILARYLAGWDVEIAG